MPAARERYDVPELHGNARGETFHPRPFPLALGNAQWTDKRKGRLARPECFRRARSLPCLQRLQSRLPRECGYGDIQSGISLALLQRTVATDSRLRVRLDPRLVALRPDCARVSELCK